MFKRRLSGKMLAMLGVMLVALCVSAFAGLRDGSWEVNPAAFRYDMSLYFKLADEDYEDLDKYEIGAFVGDECRGLAEKLELTEGETCLYMRIRSNQSSGEAIDFLLRNKESGDTVVLKAKDGADFLFKSGDRIGLPSDPFLMTRFYNVSVKSEGKGSVDFADGLYAVGSVLDLTAVPSDGYHFEEWSDGSKDASLSVTVDGDLEIVATFAPNTYKAVFEIDGEEVAVLDVACDSAIEAPEAPAKVGYSFDGWADIPETMPAHDITVTGSYTINTYKAVFKVDDAVVASYDLEYGAPVPTPETPVREGYSFNGWGELPATMPAHDIEMHSSYTINQYLLTFRIGDEVIFSSEVAYGASIVAPEAPAKDGYVFVGWADLPSVMPAGNLEVVGSYDVIKYNVTFRIGDEVISEAQLPFGAELKAPEAPEREGYSFAGWGEYPTTMPAHDLEVSGSYDVNSYMLTFVIGEETILSSELPFGTSIIAPEAPAKDGYSFKGWDEVPETMPAKDLTVSGSYEINKYKLTFRIGEEVIAESELEYGAEVKSPEAPEKEGYTFAGWSEFPASMPAYNVDVLGSYDVNMYELSFTIGDEVIFSEKIPYGSSIVAPEAPARDGYAFTGWGEVPTVMPAQDLAFSGNYEATEFNVVYKVDGEVVYEAKVKIGEAVPAYEATEKEGYSFSGWGEVPSVMPAQDLEFSGNYTVNSYKLVFKASENVIFEGELTYGTEISIPEAPEMEGHTFLGWKDVPATMPARDLVFESSYSVNVYTVKFLIDNQEFASVQYEFGAPIVAPEAPEQEGHSFSGWGDIPATMPSHDMVFGGTYAENFYTVTFRLDGTVLFTDDVEYGSEISVPSVPEREGYTFNGWGGEIPAVMPAYNLEYDGSYTANNYAVSFKIGDEVIYSGTLAYGSEVVAPDAPVKEGHTFGGWGVVPATMPAGDLEITGSYEVNYYTVSYMVDGEVFNSATMAYGTELIAPEAPAKEGHSFVGWSNLPAAVPAYDILIDGTYSVNNYNLVFRIGDEEIFSGAIAYGSAVVAPEAPAKEGHTFAGWGMVPATMPASDLAIEGTYNVNSYNLTFLIDGESFSSASMPYGTSISAPEAPAKEGYSFVGWNDVPAVMPATDVVVSGTYAINSYKLVFKASEDVVFEGVLTYGSEISIPEAPAKEGHSFSGWGMVPATMPASDLVVSGEYKVNNYNLTYRIDDQDFYSIQIPFGSAITVPQAPAKEGHSFTGWADAVATMPANDLIISGSYKVNSYGLIFKVGDVEVFAGQIPYGTEIVAPEAPAKEGHTFTGWGMVPATMPASDLEFNGSYDVNIYNLAFDIDGVPFFQTQLAYGTEIVAPNEIPDKEGNTFAGWGDVPATMPANDLAISGTYSPNHYTLTFKIGDVVVFTGEQPYGSEIVAPEAPYKEGYSFVGWSDFPATVPAENVEVLGEYQINQYELKFSVEGVELYSGMVTYGEPIEIPEVEPKRGHSFAGFGVVPATMPASDLHITGNYEINNYSVVFKVGEDVVYSGLVPFNGSIEVPAAPAKDGHVFLGWDGVPSAMPDRDMTFEGKYSVNSYKLTFRLDNKVVSSENVEFGAEIAAPEVADKEGYTFGGWGIVPAVMPASDLEISGKYEVNHYNIVFRVGEDILVSAQVPFGAKLEVPTAPEKEGHTFTGWGDVPQTMPSKDLEFVGGFDVNKYNLSFKIGEETLLYKEVAFGDAIDVPEAPAKEGYSFTGWGVVPAVMPASDLVFTGAYDVNYYSVVFKLAEEVFHSVQLPYGAELAAPEAPAKEGYTFTGWDNEVPAAMPAADLEFKGDYTVNSYKLVFKLDSEVYAESTVEFGSEIAVPAVPDKKGHTFSGFGIVPAVMPASDLEFSGVYDVNNYSVIFKINDDVVYSAQLPYGSEIVAPEAPSSEGYTFSGWSEYPSVVPDEEVVVTGTYTTNVYRAVFKIDGEMFETLEVPFREALKAPEAPEKEGYTFSGWDEVPETMPARDIEINGSYTVNVYKAVFSIDGEEVAVVEVPFGEAVKTPEVEEREGFTFSGWSEIPETMPAHDIEVSGAYVANVYKAVFMIDGVEFKTIDVTFGDEIEAPEAPEKEGYTFSGWDEIPETMPARDIEINGSYTVNVYKAVFSIDGEEVAVVEVPFGEAVKAPEVEEREGFTFSGWSEIPETMPAHDIEVSGAYVANVYKVVFMLAGTEFKTIEVTFGAEIEAPEAPEKEGYTFEGWMELPETMPAHDLVVNGEYSVNHYRLIVYLNDEVYMNEEIAYGAEVVIPTPEVETGKKFDGWQEEVPATMPAHDVEIHGTVSDDGTVFVDGVYVGPEVTVYTMDGVLLYKNIRTSDIKERLTPGVYIINGKKMVVR